MVRGDGRDPKKVDRAVTGADAVIAIVAAATMTRADAAATLMDLVEDDSAIGAAVNACGPAKAAQRRRAR